MSVSEVPETSATLIPMVLLEERIGEEVLTVRGFALGRVSEHKTVNLH
jgi:hypothetical protein